MNRSAVLLLILVLAAAGSFVGLKVFGPSQEKAESALNGQDELDAGVEAIDQAETVETMGLGEEQRGAGESMGDVVRRRLVPWPHESSDLAPTDRATFGHLPNGMRYVVMPNAEPPGQVSLRLHIDAGSLMESEEQRGLAHFLEHMVFNGSKNFTPDELIPQMQRLGIRFGAHANAYTSFDETVYMLDLPNVEESTLDLAFTVMRDFADGALLDEKEIDKERGVILSEKNARDSVRMRIMEEQFTTILPNFLATKRFPIGTAEVIKKAPRELFVDFYEKYYNPSRMTFVVVGDVTAGDAVARLTESFTTLEDPDEIGTYPKMGEIMRGQEEQGLRAHVFADDELATDEVSVLFARPDHPENDSVAARSQRLPLALANMMLNQRFSRIAKEEGSPILSGSASRSSLFQEIEFGSVDVECEAGNWKKALPVMEQEFRRVLEHGFTESEFVEVKATVINQYEQLVKRQETRRSADWAMAFVHSVNDRKVVSSPEEDLAVLKETIEDVTPSLCHQFFIGFWQTEEPNLILTTKKKAQGMADELMALYKESQKQPVEALDDEGVKAFAYTDFGDAGTVVKREAVEGLDFEQVVLSNGVRVNLKKTDFQKNVVGMQLRFGDGLLTLPTGKVGLGSFATQLVNLGGLGQHSNDDLERILAGKNVGVGFSVNEDAFYLSGSTTPDDLELQLQLMAAYLTDAGYREEAVRQYRKSLPGLYEQMEHSMQGAAAEMSAWMRGNDERYVIPPLAQAMGYEVADVKSWLEPAMKTGYLELTLVGDLDLDATLVEIEKTIGALGQRQEEKAAHTEKRQMPYPKVPDTKSFSYDSKIPRCLSVVAWKTRGVGTDISETRRMNLLANVLTNRVRDKLREELGATYSPSARADMSFLYADYGHVVAQAVVTPEDAVMVNDLMVEIGEKMAEEGVSDDEFDRALKPTLSTLKESLRDNGYWQSTVMGSSQEYPERLKWARERDADYAGATVEDLNELAKRYLKKDNCLKMELVPVPLPASDEDGSAEDGGIGEKSEKAEDSANE